MKTILPFLTSLLLLVSLCDQKNSTHQPGEPNQVAGNQPVELTMHEYRDIQNGLLLSRVPFPSTWSINNHLSSEYPIIKGLNDLAIYNLQSKIYRPEPIPDWYSSYGDNSITQRSLLTIEEIIQQDFENESEYKRIETIDLPEVVAKLKLFEEQLFKTTQETSLYRVVATDWLYPFLTVLYSQTSSKSNWSFFINRY